MYAIQTISVVYFHQRMGALHAVCCLKSFVYALKQGFLSFSVTNGKKELKIEIDPITDSIHINESIFSEPII